MKESDIAIHQSDHLNRVRWLKIDTDYIGELHNWSDIIQEQSVNTNINTMMRVYLYDSIRT